MSDTDHPQPPPAPTFRDLLAAAEAARRISTPPPATPRPAIPDEDAA
ncbi:hypothetical protein [Streptomyces sp. NBC_01198]|nr:hypothetical protein OG702_13850 [Streptomyces sp. NBC_01198]